jgi:hypothetical protein
VVRFPGALQAVTWSSSYPGVATVDATGEITAIAATGTAVITATVVENTGLTATCAVTILPSITLTLAGYNGSAATLAYTDNTASALTLANNTAIIVREDTKTVKSITLYNGATFLIGRKANSDISLKISGTTLDLRDAVDGFIPVGSYAEFQLIRGSAVAGSYKQEADIDLMDEPWTPIGATQTAAFSGTFDGAGYTLSNILVNSTEGEGRGLFGNAIGATFNNVRLISGSVTSNQSCTGGICGWSRNATFFACLNNATISGANNSTGGICGYSNSVFIACRNSGNVTTSGQYAGGIAAYHIDWSGATTGIVACYNTGRITATAATAFNVGGIVGQTNSTAGIIACYNTGEISMTAASKGGIAGTSSVATTGCYWSGTVANAVGANTGTLTKTQKFSSSAWPSAAIHAEWGTGDGSGSGKYWKSLGSWNGGSPTYPKLFFEQ